MSDTATLSRLFAIIGSDLEAVDQTFQTRITSGLDILNAAAAHALSSPGKRLRMALTLLSGKLFDYRLDKLLPLSVAFEMAHLATLIHDDIIDSAATRRGIPTVNARYGDHIAILLGDYLFAKTAGLAAEVGDHRVDQLLADTVATVCEGTIIEMLSARRLDLSIENYLERIRCKTACLIAACCKGGAIIGGGTDEQIELLHQYGHNLGMAFQIADDVLDYAGSQANTGKPVGNDLAHGLVTLPLIYALRAGQNGRAEHIASVLEQLDTRQEEVREIVAWVNAGTGVPDALDLARQYAARAQASLMALAPSPERAVLEELVDFVVARDR
jgi:geranylgeranyl pyrophosphate synthase